MDSYGGRSGSGRAVLFSGKTCESRVARTVIVITQAVGVTISNICLIH